MENGIDQSRSSVFDDFMLDKTIQAEPLFVLLMYSRRQETLL